MNQESRNTGIHEEVDRLVPKPMAWAPGNALGTTRSTCCSLLIACLYA